MNLESNRIKLESVAFYFHGKVDVYYALEDMHPYFAYGYGILGTPTYLILNKGTVLGTILGNNSHLKLIRHASYILLDRHTAFPVPEDHIA